jgi:hypothetical protein
MIIVYGTRLFGRADVVEGVGHVSCRFVHVMFLPLVPFESVFLLDSSDGETRGMTVPFSFKAALSGWMRGGAILGTIASTIGAVASFVEGEILGGVVAVFCALFSVFLFFAAGWLFGRCSPARRAELLGKLGIDAGPPEHGAPTPFVPQQAPPAGGYGVQPGYGAQSAYGAPSPYGYGQPQQPTQAAQGYGYGYGTPPQQSMPSPQQGYGAPQGQVPGVGAPVPPYPYPHGGGGGTNGGNPQG